MQPGFSQKDLKACQQRQIQNFLFISYLLYGNYDSGTEKEQIIIQETLVKLVPDLTNNWF